MTKATAKSVTEFSTEDTVVPTRPTTTIEIGGRTYNARAPKMKIWMDTGFMLERLDKGDAAQKRLESGEPIGITERRELEKAASAMPEPEEIHELLIDGRLADARLHGGFLRRCLPAEDYARLAADLDDEESELDIPDLYDAAFGLYSEFEVWFTQRAEMIGMMAPKAKAGARKRSTGTTGKTTRTASRAGARRTSTR